jgi:hypothetical protein
VLMAIRTGVDGRYKHLLMEKQACVDDRYGHVLMSDKGMIYIHDPFVT